MHPWIWLNEPQHGTAIAAIAAIAAAGLTAIYTVAAIVAGKYAVKTYETGKETLLEAKRAAEEAKQQTRFVKKQAETQLKQFELVERQYAEEAVRRQMEAAEQASRDEIKLLAEHDRERVMRPRFSIVGSLSMSNRAITELKNIGQLDAYEMKFCALGGNVVTKEWEIFRSGDVQRCELNAIEMANQGLLLSFRTINQTAWTLLLYTNKAERDSVVEVKWPKILG